MFENTKSDIIDPLPWPAQGKIIPILFKGW